ncbi:hypothetical protein HPO96_31380 [Kribbella sandramycini]|uniref:Uncharacterized protein n=1 Tax=Kribbella sandramycini TaxID=60450 RepID=A0A7Y4P1Y0_9ACTN|nr:hypothetical protein [Kribbella sandramycini]MBB6567041.1 hypothetical protein [Kribbella sandramycini]NOL44762.1 hypothetical protein [Kribbella sandramycini]
MQYADFDAENRRITGAYGRETADPEALQAAADRLRAQSAAIASDADRAKAFRHLTLLDEFIESIRTPAPSSQVVWAANDAMIRGLSTTGTPAEQRARASAAIEEIGRIAAAAPTGAERDAALEMNGALAEFIRVLDGETR